MDTVVTSCGRSLRVGRIDRCRSKQGQSGIFGICDGCLNYESPELSTSKKSGSARQSAVHRRGTNPRPSSSSKGSEETPRSDVSCPFLPHSSPPISPYTCLFDPTYNLNLCQQDDNTHRKPSALDVEDGIRHGNRVVLSKRGEFQIPRRRVAVPSNHQI